VPYRTAAGGCSGCRRRAEDSASGVEAQRARHRHAGVPARLAKGVIVKTATDGPTARKLCVPRQRVPQHL